MSRTQSNQTNAQPLRVASLMPEATELLCYIGGRPLLVARSAECDFPEDVASLPAVTSIRVFSKDPADWDREVQTFGEEHLAPYVLDASALAALRPDVILAQAADETNSVDPRTIERAAASFSLRPILLTFNPHSIEDVLDDTLRLGQHIGLAPHGVAAMVALRGRFHRATDFVNPYADPIPVVFLQNLDPLFIAGHWITQLIERAGGSHPLNPSTPAPNSGAAAGPQMAQRLNPPPRAVSAQDLIDAQPQFLFLGPTGLTKAEARAAAAKFFNQRWFNLLPAVRMHTPERPRIFLFENHHPFTRPGPRLADAFDWLVALLQGRPELLAADSPVNLQPAPYPLA